MGRHYVNKLLLLDEHDLARASPAATFADFVPAAEAFWEEGFAWSEFPECELIGVASERFDDAFLRDGNYAEPTWLRQAGWATILAGAVDWALSDIPQYEELLSNETDVVEDQARPRLMHYVETAQYALAGQLAHILDGLQRSGVAGFRERHHMTSGGEDDLLDYRSQECGTGHRVLLEIAFVWD